MTSTAPREVKAHGPRTAEVVIIGEAPGEHEERTGVPFVGASGSLLDNMLNAVDLCRAKCLVANVSRRRPPGNEIKRFFMTKTAATKAKVPARMGRYPTPELSQEIDDLHRLLRSLPNLRLIICLGGTPLWALTGNEGITDWRGSILEWEGYPLVPTFHPAAVLRQMDLAPIFEFDLRRASEILADGVPKAPLELYIAPPSYQQAVAVLELLRDERKAVAVDVETLGDYIQCIGLAWTESHAICIPFAAPDYFHWYTHKEEAHLVRLLRQVLEGNPCIWQNYAFDAQRIFHDWGFIPGCHFDTMAAQQVMYPGMPKNLNYLSSLYLPWHRFWKGTAFIPGQELWEYNCRDAARTYALVEPMREGLKQLGVEDVYREDASMLGPVVATNINGCRVDLARREELRGKCAEGMTAKKAWLEKVLGHEVKPSSNPQMHTLLYHDFQVTPILDRKTRRPTLGGRAMQKIAQDEPLLQPLLRAVEAYRSLQELKSTFLEAELDPWDQRLRTSYAQRTETGRFAARTSAFWRGTNLANVPNPRTFDGVGEVSVRSVFLPEENEIMCECDLDRADAQVVAWEADDPLLKAMFREGVDIHTENAKQMGVSRAMAKKGIHAVNYGTTARTLAIELGITIKEAEAFMRRWFQIHPPIVEWHKRVRAALAVDRCITNIFGRKLHFLGRIDDQAFKSALAANPQSTVAEVINRGWKRLAQELPIVSVLLQVHDSLVMSRPRAVQPATIRRCLVVEVPYPDPLTIPVSYKEGPNWGALHGV